MALKKTEPSPEQYWQEYEEKTGEKVIEKGIGQYISGWEEFDSKGLKDIMGLIIVTSGGLRFHHFPQQHWVDLFSRSRKAPPEESSFFIPSDSILSVQHIEETRWWKKLLKPNPQKLIIRFRDESEKEQQLLLESDFNIGEIPEALEAVER